jgi:hypothetical protein
MIIQTVMTRDECFLIKELFPLWQKYADGFVFMVDSRTTDETRDFLNDHKSQYNILEIFDYSWDFSNIQTLEAAGRQALFNKAYKYSNKIISLDSDEYLDGPSTKEQLEILLDKTPDTVFLLHWEQYTSKHQIRVDGVWGDPYHDRIGSYTYNAQFDKTFNHSSHLPKDKISNKIKQIHVDPKQLFIAHLQWLDKPCVGIKQYYWKIWDYVQHKERGANIIDRREYDASVNNFNWSYKDFHTPLKVRENIYKTQDIKQNYKLQYIKEQTLKYNIPNLNDWGLGIYDYCLK